MKSQSSDNIEDNCDDNDYNAIRKNVFALLSELYSFKADCIMHRAFPKYSEFESNSNFNIRFNDNPETGNTGKLNNDFTSHIINLPPLHQRDLIHNLRISHQLDSGLKYLYLYKVVDLVKLTYIYYDINDFY